jgi:UDP-glucose 4-epimerase
MKIAVTGGAGYIGSMLVKRLIDEGSSVASVDNLVSGSYEPLQGLKTKKMVLHIGDIRDGNFLVELFKGSESIAHLAAIPGLIKCRNNPEEAISVNVYGTHQVLEAARKLDIEKVVFCSTAAVYGKPVEMPQPLWDHQTGRREADGDVPRQLWNGDHQPQVRERLWSGYIH